MLPLKLSIEGLYSYQEKQTIDFENLTNAGLFGIFGPVGSGKSSILEAISFALYGETERLNNKEKRAYNMLNLKSKKAEIIFEFQNYEGDIYQFAAEWKRKKKFEDIDKVNRSAYKKVNGEWLPLESANAEKVIGLNYDNFRRTIIIPQGKFQEFLQLGGNDRSIMLKEIFNLQRFDLYGNTSLLNKKNQSKIDGLIGKLSNFLPYTPEYLAEKKAAHDAVLENLTALKNKTASAEKELKTLQDLKEKFELLKKRTEEYELLNQQKENIDAIDSKVQVFEKTAQQFSAVLKAKENVEQKKNKTVSDIENLSNTLSKLKKDLHENEALLEMLRPQFEQLDQLKNQCKEYDFLIQIKKNEQEKTTVSARIDKGKHILTEKENEVKEVQSNILITEKELEELRAIKINTEELMAVGSWFSAFEQQQKQKHQFAQKLQEIEFAIQENLISFSKLNLNAENWELNLKEQLSHLESQLENIQKEEQHYLLAEKLSQFAHNLKDGEPCPLCGSLEHPELMETENVAEHLTLLKDKKQNVNQTIKTLHQVTIEAQKRITEQQTLMQRKQEIAREIQQNKYEEEQLNHQFIWPDYQIGNKDLFLSKKAEAARIEKELNTKDNNLKAERVKLENAQQDLKNYYTGIQELSNQEITLTAQIEQNIAHLNYLDIADFQEKNNELLISEQAALKLGIEKTNHDFNQLNHAINEQRTTIATKDGELSNLSIHLNTLFEELLEITTEIQNSLSINKFKSIEEVKEILGFAIDIEAEKKKIIDFRQMLFSAEQNLLHSKKELGNNVFNEQEFQEKSENFLQLKTAVNEMIGQEASLKSEVEAIRQKIVTKGKIETSLKQLSIRAANLKTLSNMFSGSGFVNYVSGIYLQHLCNSANVRFHKLSKNQLSLCLNEKNEFEVRDYLHDGHCRSVKTLSGGQTFQASLSLALALAESVQSLNKSGKNFFFIDEGFGTQDKEMIQAVFETLQALHKENRIVGIISHVEELQEQMPISLMIRKDAERGSLIN